LLSAWIPCLLFAAVIVVGVPLLCWLVSDEPPDNAIAQEQGNEPRKPAKMTLAA
jgi:hypothetical protein